MSSTGGAADPRVKAAVHMMKAHPTVSLPQAMLLAKFSESECKNRTIQMRVRRAHSAQMPMIGTDIDVAGTPTMSSLSTQEGTMTKTSIPAVSNASSAAADDVVTALFPAPRPEEPPRPTAQAKQKERCHKLKIAAHAKKAHKRATSFYASELKKPKAQRFSADAISKIVKKEYDGHGPSARSIQRYVNDHNNIGISPVKMGSRGNIPPWAYSALCNAFDSYVRIMQVNSCGHENTRRVLSAKVNAAMGVVAHSNNKLYYRVVRDTATDMRAAKVTNVEDRRVQWTTHKNLKLWFENWGKDLVELGFAHLDEHGDVIIPDDQLHRILNFDETCLSHDGSNGARGGRPEVFIYDPRLPLPGKRTSKCSSTTTMITGSTAAGEALPPHFQFQTSAKSHETQRIRIDVAGLYPKVVMALGTGTDHELDCTFGMNAKGGMDQDEFEKYMMLSLVDRLGEILGAADLPGKRVMVKCDSGPGRLNVELLARMKFFGFYLYPSVPNTTAVSQETDRNYGPFKTQFRKNLDEVIDARIKGNHSTSIAPHLVGLTTFGGVDPTSDHNVKISAFERGFSKEACLSAWAKVGAAPLSMKCLDDQKVRKSTGDGDEEWERGLRELQNANDLATFLLTRGGFNGDLLKAELKTIDEPTVLTRPHTKERVELLAKATTHGTKWMATGGSHLMTEDFFKSVELPKRENEIKAMEMDKLERIKGDQLRRNAEVILVARRDALVNKQYNVLNAAELETLLKWHNVPKAHKEKKAGMIARWATIWEGGLKPPFFEVWTDVDESKLEELKAMDIDMSQTALGRLKELKKREAFISVREMNEEEREKMRRSLDEIEAKAAAALENITADFPTEEGAEEGAEDGVNFGEMDAV